MCFSADVLVNVSINNVTTVGTLFPKKSITVNHHACDHDDEKDEILGHIISLTAVRNGQKKR